MNQDKIPALLREALAFHNQGSLDKAEALYVQILLIDSLNYHSLRFLGSLYRSKGLYSKGIDLLCRAAMQYPDDIEILINLGNLYLDYGSHHQAVEIFEKCLLLDGSRASALVGIGWSLSELGRLTEAANALKTAITIHPSLYQAWLNLGTTYMRQNNFLGAIQCYQKAISLAPGCTDAYLNLGSLYRANFCHLDAIAIYQKALQSNPDCIQIYVELGKALLDSSDAQSAANVLHEAVELDPSSNECHILLGHAYHRLGNQQESINSYLRGISPNHCSVMAIYGLFDAFRSSERQSDISLTDRLTSSILQLICRDNVFVLSQPEDKIFGGMNGFVPLSSEVHRKITSFPLDTHDFSAEDILSLLHLHVPCSSYIIIPVHYFSLYPSCFSESLITVDARRACSEANNEYLRRINLLQSGGFNLIVCGIFDFPAQSVYKPNLIQDITCHLQVEAETSFRKECLDNNIPFFTLPYEFKHVSRDIWESPTSHISNPLTTSVDPNISAIKNILLTRLLQAINVTRRSSLSFPKYKYISLLDSDTSCLIDLFSSNRPTFIPLGKQIHSSSIVQLLSHAKQSILLDLSACRHVEIVQLSFSIPIPENLQIWGLDNNGNRFTAAMTVTRRDETQVETQLIHAAFPRFTMLRYLFIILPDNMRISLTYFDVLGTNSIFTQRLSSDES